MSEYHYHRCCGDSAIWDFSDARPTTRSHYVQWFNFGDSALVKVVGDKMQCAFQLCGDSLIMRGYESPLLCVYDSIAPVIFTGIGNPANLLQSPFYFKGTYSEKHKVDMQGEMQIGGFKRGRLILLGDTIDNAFVISAAISYLMRVDSEDDTSSSGSSHSNYLSVIDSVCYWYSPHSRYPVVENRSRDFHNSDRHLRRVEHTYICHPDEQDYSLGRMRDSNAPLIPHYSMNDDLSMSLLERVSIRMNPDDMLVSVSGNRDDRFSIMISDLQGRVWYNRKGCIPDEGLSTATIKTDDYNSGIYIIKVISGEDYIVNQVRIK